jgi:hypothetical protein
VIGAPGENDNRAHNPWAALSGRVTILRGGPKGIRARGSTVLDRHTPGMPRTGTGFGYAIALLDHNGDGRLDLTVGSAGIDTDNDTLAKGTLVTLPGRRRDFTTQHAAGIDWTHIGAHPRDETRLGSVLGR